jgi:DnaA-homolog protein
MLPPTHAPQLALDIGLDDRAGFESYYPGPNEQVLAAVRACAEGSGERALYIHGASGLGKTHLLQAACRSAAAGGQRAGYVPLADALAWSVQLLEGLAALDLVAVDDLQLVAGRAEWEEALFHLFNSVREAGGRLLFAASVRPAELGLALPDLLSRLQWGLVLRLREPADEDKVASLRLRAAQRGLELPSDVAHYLMARCPRDLGYLFTLLDRLDQASLMAQRRLTLPFVREVLDGQAAGERD